MSKNFTIGAFDRFNLGDLAFAEIAQKYFGKIELYSPFGADFSDLNSIKSEKLSNIPNEGNFIFAGGEILSSGWFGAYMSLKNPGYRDLVQLHNHRTEKIFDLVFFNSRRNRWKTPYIPNPEKFKGKYVYLAVAGRTHVDKIRNLPVKQTYLSVRDEATYRLLEPNHKGIQLSPDPVSTLALDHLERIQAKKYEKLVIQCSYPWYKQNRLYLNNLIENALREGMKISFLPFGYTYGHADQVAYYKISKMYPDVALIQPCNLGEYISVLTNCDLFLGTSLHGHIISSALAVANFPLPGIIKVANYTNTWSPELGRISKDFIELPQILDFLNDYSEKFQENRIRNARLAEDNIVKAVDFLS